MPQSKYIEIKNYYVLYYAGGKKVTQPYPYRSIVGLYGDDGIIAGLYFHNDSSTMPDSDHLPDTGQPMLHYPVSDFANVIDLLRNESPVYYREVGGWSMGSITTTMEPVGEGEPT